MEHDFNLQSHATLLAGNGLAPTSFVVVVVVVVVVIIIIVLILLFFFSAGIEKSHDR